MGRAVNASGHFPPATDWRWDLREVSSTLRSLVSPQLDMFLKVTLQCRFQVLGCFSGLSSLFLPAVLLKYLLAILPRKASWFPKWVWHPKQRPSLWNLDFPKSLLTLLSCVPVLWPLLSILISYFQGLSYSDKLTCTHVFMNPLLRSHLN